MQGEWDISRKRQDTGKSWRFGNIKQGKFGPQLSFKKTPELVALWESTQEGGWLNFSLYESKPKDEPKEVPKAGTKDIDDSLPF